MNSDALIFGLGVGVLIFVALCAVCLFLNGIRGILKERK